MSSHFSTVACSASHPTKKLQESPRSLIKRNASSIQLAIDTFKIKAENLQLFFERPRQARASQIFQKLRSCDHLLILECFTRCLAGTPLPSRRTWEAEFERACPSQQLEILHSANQAQLATITPCLLKKVIERHFKEIEASVRYKLLTCLTEAEWSALFYSLPSDQATELVTQVREHVKAPDLSMKPRECFFAICCHPRLEYLDLSIGSFEFSRLCIFFSDAQICEALTSQSQEKLAHDIQSIKPDLAHHLLDLLALHSEETLLLLESHIPPSSPYVGYILSKLSTEVHRMKLIEEAESFSPSELHLALSYLSPLQLINFTGIDPLVDDETLAAELVDLSEAKLIAMCSHSAYQPLLNRHLGQLSKDLILLLVHYSEVDNIFAYIKSSKEKGDLISLFSILMASANKLPKAKLNQEWKAAFAASSSKISLNLTQVEAATQALQEVLKSEEALAAITKEELQQLWGSADRSARLFFASASEINAYRDIKDSRSIYYDLRIHLQQTLDQLEPLVRETSIAVKLFWQEDRELYQRAIKTKDAVRAIPGQTSSSASGELFGWIQPSDIAAGAALGLEYGSTIKTIYKSLRRSLNALEISGEWLESVDLDYESLLSRQLRADNLETYCITSRESLLAYLSSSPATSPHHLEFMTDTAYLPAVQPETTPCEPHPPTFQAQLPSFLAQHPYLASNPLIDGATSALPSFLPETSSTAFHCFEAGYHESASSSYPTKSAHPLPTL